ncbi:MAG: hypothetical protein ACO4AV_15985, partial [bacterium]
AWRWRPPSSRSARGRRRRASAPRPVAGHEERGAGAVVEQVQAHVRIEDRAPPLGGYLASG